MRYTAALLFFFLCACAEERIANIPNELMRRDPEILATWELFKIVCGESGPCEGKEVSEILAQRDQRIAETWPVIFDRFVDPQNWGARHQTELAHEQFRRALEEKGADTLRDRCVPKIRYQRLPNGAFVCRMEGYGCKKS